MSFLMVVIKFSSSVVFSLNSMTKKTTLWPEMELATNATSVTLKLDALLGSRRMAYSNKMNSNYS